MRKLAGLALAVAAASAGQAHAQAVATYKPELDPDRFVLTADPYSVGLTEGATPLAKYEFSLGLGLRLGGPPLQACARQINGACASEGDIVSTRFGSDLVAAFGLGEVGLYAQLPVILYQGSDFDFMKGNELQVAGIGDLRLGGKVRVLHRGGDALALDVRGLVPTGGSDFKSDAGHTTLEGRAIYEHRDGRFAFDVQGGYAWRQRAAEIGSLYVADEILWSVAVGYGLTADNKLVAGIAGFGRVGFMSEPNPMPGTSGKPSNEERPTEVMASVHYSLSKTIALEAGAGTGLTDGYGAPDFRALVAMRYFHERDCDPDHDGISSCTGEDKCPNDPEDFDNFEDKDGCPDPDNDHDKILDKDDACPNDPEDYDGFEDKDGCPEPDNDHDGIPDKADACPNDPEDFDGFEDKDGCPEADNDKDGILDKEDHCPNDPEDKDGFEDQDGCPENDNDKDGILDKDDKCPNVAENKNGYQDEDGCPDSPLVTVTTTAIEIKETIYFDLDKATIKPVSFPLLDGVVLALQTHATIEIRIEGHTDDQGDAAYNLKLSQRRAESVRDYLVEHGIDTKRLTPVGFGKNKPKMPGKTKAARDVNRRVEFIITNQPAAAPAPAPAPAPQP